MFCPYCRASTSDDAVFCPKCGKQIAVSTPVSPRSQTLPSKPTYGLTPGLTAVGIFAVIFVVIILSVATHHTTKTANVKHQVVARQSVTHQVVPQPVKAGPDETALAAKEEVDLKAVAGLLNQSGNIVTGYGIQGTSGTIQLDGDIWEPLSDQDKTLLKQSLEQAWTTTWSHYHPMHGATQLTFDLVDLANDKLYSDVIDLPDTSHPERAAYEQSRLSGLGAYKVIEQWDIPCAGSGGLGQRAIVMSHKASDLPTAYHRFIASLNGDRSKCITFDVFANEDALTESKSNSDTYTDAEMKAQWDNELEYIYNPTSGFEQYTFGTKRLADGSIDVNQQILHGGNAP